MKKIIKAPILASRSRRHRRRGGAGTSTPASDWQVDDNMRRSTAVKPLDFFVDMTR